MESGNRGGRADSLGSECGTFRERPPWACPEPGLLASCHATAVGPPGAEAAAGTGPGPWADRGRRSPRDQCACACQLQLCAAALPAHLKQANSGDGGRRWGNGGCFSSGGRRASGGALRPLVAAAGGAGGRGEGAGAPWEPETDPETPKEAWRGEQGQGGELVPSREGVPGQQEQGLRPGGSSGGRRVGAWGEDGGVWVGGSPAPGGVQGCTGCRV